MKQETHYKIIKMKSTDSTESKMEFGLEISSKAETITVEQISPDLRQVKEIVRKLKPHNLSPAIAKEIIEDLIY